MEGVILINSLLKKFVPLVDFLAEVLGHDAEIVLHDVSNMDNSVVAIRNGHISGRKIGAPATNLALKIMKDANYSNTNYLCNYKGISESGKTLKSSTYFIRNDKQLLVGILCINIDFEKYVPLKNHLDSIVNFCHENNEKAVERFSNSVEEVAFSSIETIINNTNISPERMSQEEKIEIIKELNDSGVFLLKGAVSEVAAQLKVSEATIYRYLNKIKRKEE